MGMGAVLVRSDRLGHSHKSCEWMTMRLTCPSKNKIYPQRVRTAQTRQIIIRGFCGFFRRPGFMESLSILIDGYAHIKYKL